MPRGIDDCPHAAGAGDVVEDLPLVFGEVFAVFHTVRPSVLSAVEGLPGTVGSRGLARRLWRNGDNWTCIPSAAGWREDMPGLLAGSSGWVPARCSAASGMPSPSVSGNSGYGGTMIPDQFSDVVAIGKPFMDADIERQLLHMVSAGS